MIDSSALVYLALFAAAVPLLSKYIGIASSDPRAVVGHHMPEARSLWVIYALVVSVVIGLRDGVGIDYQSYVALFHGINSGEAVRSIEPGFRLLNKLVAYLGAGTWLVFLVATAATQFLLLSTIARFSARPALSVLAFYGMGFFFFSLSGIRQALAIAIVFYALRYIDGRNLLKSLLLVLIAMTFHWSAAVALPAYWVAGRRIPHVLLWVLLGLSLAVLYVGDVQSAAVRLLESFGPNHYMRYILMIGQREGAVRGGYFVSLQVLFLAGLVVAYPRLWVTFLPHEQRALNLTIIGYLSLFVFAHFYTIVRVAMFYKIFEVLTFASIVRGTKHVWLRHLVASLFVLVFAVMTFYALYNNGYKVVPYRSVLPW